MKVKSYVHANGTLIAEQQMAWNGSGQEEWVLFNHQDASGASLQKTRENGALEVLNNNYRSAEFDPLGQDVGWYDQYIVINEVPPEHQPGSGGPLLPTETWSTMVNGRLTSFAIDGIPVSREYFQTNLEAAFPGGVQFGVLQMQARMSAQPPREIGRWVRTETWSTNDSQGDVIGTGTHTTSYVTNIVYAHSSWSLSSLIGFFNQQTTKDIKLTKEEIKGIREQLLTALDSKKSPNGERCRKFLNETLRNLGSRFNDIMDVFDLYARKKAIYNAPIQDGEAPHPAVSKKARLRLGLDNHERLIQKGLQKSDYTVLTVFHELIHGAGRATSYDHIQMGGAMYRAAVRLGFMDERELTEIDSTKLSNDLNVEFKVLGEYYKVGDEALKAACGGSKGRGN